MGAMSIDCLLNHFVQAQIKENKLRVTSLCEGNSPVTDEFPSQKASNAENVHVWWCGCGDAATISW